MCDSIDVKDGSLGLIAGMGNLWFDVDTGGSPIMPFLDGGVGIGRITLNGVSSEQEFPESSATAFAFQAGAGIGFDLGAGFAIRLGYRLFGTTETQLVANHGMRRRSLPAATPAPAGRIPDASLAPLDCAHATIPSACTPPTTIDASSMIPSPNIPPHTLPRPHPAGTVRFPHCTLLPMIRRLILLALMGALAGMSAWADGKLTVVSWGGAYGRATDLALLQPFAAATGATVRMEDYNGGLAEIRAQVETGNVHWDVIDLESSDLTRACDEGLLESIDFDVVFPG